MTSINTNIAALTSQASMEKHTRTMKDAMEQLSTGFRINSAADDAAGSAIASKMEAQIRSLDVAIRNSNDAVSLTQTAQGALGEIENILQRIRELAVQAGNSTLNSTDRLAIQAEVDSLSAEIDSIASKTNFNNVNLLDGSRGSVSFQVGIHASDVLSLALENTDVSSLGIGSSATASTITSARAEILADIAATDVKINGENWASADFDASAYTYQGATHDATGLVSPATDGTAGRNAAVIADAINSNSHVHGAVASAYNVVRADSASYSSNTATINGVSLAAQATKQDFVDAVNNEVAGVTAEIDGNGIIVLSNNTGYNLNLAGNITSMGFTADVYGGFVTLENANGSDVSIEAGTDTNGYSSDTGELTDVIDLGFNEIRSGVVSGSAKVSTTALAATDNVRVNGVLIGDSDNGSAQSKAAAINALSAQHGVVATAKTEVKVTVDLDGATMSNHDDVSINGITVDLSGDVSLSDIVAGINSAVGSQTDIKATADEDGFLILTSASGVNIVVDDDVDDDDAGGLFTAATSLDGSATTTAYGSGGFTQTGTLTLTSADGTPVQLYDGQADTNNGADTDGLVKLGLMSQSEDVLNTTTGLSVSTVAAANASLDKIDSAISTVTNTRSNFGAIENRLDAAVSNLSTLKLNTVASKGRIEDANFASQTSALTKAQIMNQAATSMLAQANASSQNLLALLQ
ncbi:MAG: flagellin [Parvibaculales bacterium]